MNDKTVKMAREAQLLYKNVEIVPWLIKKLRISEKSALDIYDQYRPFWSPTPIKFHPNLPLDKLSILTTDALLWKTLIWPATTLK